MFPHLPHNQGVRFGLWCCAAVLGSCPAILQAGQGRPVLPERHPGQAELEAAFDQAAADFGAPAAILKAVAFVESRWIQAGPTVDGGWGVMHLVDHEGCHTLQEAAALSGDSVERLKEDAVANIRGGAALLAHLVRQTVGQTDSIQDYRPALRALTGLGPAVQDKQVDEYYRVLSNGARVTNPLGIEILLEPVDGAAESLPATQTLSGYVTLSTDYPPAIWNPADPSNYTVGRSQSIDRWINHWIGVGTYAGAISWFQNPSSNVSAHFVIRKVDGQLTQMVRIADTAWHAGNWNYNCRSIGIEHEATTTNPWPTSPSSPMLINSATCCRYFCDLYGMPKTRTYIIGHNEVPGVATDCPGPLPWDVYMALVNNTAPVIIQEPAPQNVCPGATATFAVLAAGATPITYQWQKDGSNLTNGGHYSGATTETLTVSSAGSADVASYRCVATNSYGSDASNGALLTLKAVTAITQQPQSQSVAIGDTATFNVTATGAAPITYRWRRNGVDMSDDGRISGSATPTLSITTVGPGDVAAYTCVVTAGCGSVTSDAAGLTLAGLPGDFDGDNDVDLEDFGTFQNCLSGEGVAQEDPACARAHLEGADSDVDTADMLAFKGCMSGAGIPGDANCLD